MAEKSAIPGQDRKFMTVFRPESEPVTDENGNRLSPNDVLENQRKQFEQAENAPEESDVEQKVEEKIRDVEATAVLKKKAIHEVVEDLEKDKEAREKLAAKTQEEVEQDKKKEEAKQAQRTQQTQQTNTNVSKQKGK